MDKQISTIAQTAGLIPVNTRTIGAPEGIYIVYLEDYVHTFIKKMLSETDQRSIPLGTDPEYQIDPKSQPSIALYGRSAEENGRRRLVVSGAAVLNDAPGKGRDRDRICQLRDTYFPSSTYLGTARAGWNKDHGLRLELALDNMKVMVDDFYIFYDQNEEMQNYLIEWNVGREKNRERLVLTSDEAGPRIRDRMDDAARLGRIAQAYNREEAKVSFMWNVMNILCLGFVVCVMAYGIISINNHNKMQNMQASIDYCMAFVAEHTSFTLSDGRPAGDDGLQASQPDRLDIQEEPEPQEGLQGQADIQEEAQPGTDAGQSAQDGPDAAPQPGEEPVQESAAVQAQPEMPTVESVPVPAGPSQYYIVRRGDTLRSICFEVYGDYAHVDEVIRLNEIEDPNNILYGQKLLLP